MHDLQDLIQKIARNEKIEESKELASDIQDTLTARMQLVNHGEKNRGVKKALRSSVLIVAPTCCQCCRRSPLSSAIRATSACSASPTSASESRIARRNRSWRCATYLDNLNSLTYNKQKLVSENHLSGSHLEPATVVSTGNPK